MWSVLYQSHMRVGSRHIDRIRSQKVYIYKEEIGHGRCFKMEVEMGRKERERRKKEKKNRAMMQARSFSTFN